MSFGYRTAKFPWGTENIPDWVSEEPAMEAAWYRDRFIEKGADFRCVLLQELDEEKFRPLAALTA